MRTSQPLRESWLPWFKGAFLFGAPPAFAPARILYYITSPHILSIANLYKDYIERILKFVYSDILHSCRSCGIIRTWREVRSKVNRLEKSLQKLEKVFKKGLTKRSKYDMIISSREGKHRLTPMRERETSIRNRPTSRLGGECVRLL